MMKWNVPKWAVALFFILFVALGFLTAGDYGPSWDELDEMDILRMNLWEYSRALGIDESAFEKRAAMPDPLTISRLTPISESIEQDHGIAAFYPLAGVVMNESISEGARSAYWHMGCWAVFSLGAYALYSACRQLGLSRGFALLGPVFLLLSPLFFAHGHINNKDIALFSFALCLLWQGLKLMKAPAFSTGLLFSLFGALAANTKVAGLALWGLCAVCVLAQQLIKRRMTGRVWAVAGVTFASFFVFYALITPALWGDPAGFLRYLVENALSFKRWQNHILFRGAVFRLSEEPMPWYYLPYMIFATTPLWMIVLIAAAAVWAAVRILRKKEGLELALPLLMAVLPLAFALVTRTHVYNGWRHFFFAYGPMLALAAWAVAHMPKKRLLSVSLGICMLFSASDVVFSHPYQYTYYQPAVRLRGANFHELDYWNISARDALYQLAQETEGEIRITSADLWSDNALQKALWVMDEETASRFVITGDGEYILSNPTYEVLSHFDADGLTKAVELSAWNRPIMLVYHKTNGGSQP